MKVLLTGGTGFIGTYLVEELEQAGHEIYILTRSPEKYQNTDRITYVGWLKEGTAPEQKLPAVDAAINLAGESLFGYWTAKKKRRIIESRIEVCRQLLELMRKMKTKPEVLVSTSGINFYGTSNINAFTEATTTPGSDFLSEVAVTWEKEAKKAEAEGIRTVLTRFGMVLGNGGSLPLMSLPFKLGIGGKIGTGEQWMSWVHIRDVAGIILHSIADQSLHGPVNVTAPQPRRNKDFSQTLGEVLNRPSWFPVPATLMEKALGEMSLLVTKGQCVYPAVIQAKGYSFYYPELKDALTAVFSAHPRSSRFF